MTTNALSELEVDAKTTKRAQYEGFEFDLEAPGILQVTNGSYGDDKDDHSSRVNVENGVPVACECPADEYHSGACKHRVAVAIREPVLEAAISDGPQSKRVATDGGIAVADDEDEVLEDNGETDDDCDCDLLPGDYPCAHCYVEEGAEWPDEGSDDADPRD